MSVPSARTAVKIKPTCVLSFGPAIDVAYLNQIEGAYEEILHKFDEMLTRQGHATGQPHQRELAIHDKAVAERDVQAWDVQACTNLWRRGGLAS